MRDKIRKIVEIILLNSEIHIMSCLMWDKFFLKCKNELTLINWPKRQKFIF